jgi:hypothetical protein
MGNTKNIKNKEKVRILRSQGLSYKEILKKVPVSKSSISAWCRDITLTQEQVKRIENKKMLGIKKGSNAAALKKRQIKKNNIKRLLDIGIREVGLLTDRDRFMVGIGLYMGDGYKNVQRVGFSNSNPKIVSFVINWLRDFGKVNSKKFRGRIWIHDTNNIIEATKFWSKVSSIPIIQFTKPYVVKDKNDSKKIRNNKHKHGVFTVVVHSSSLQRRILGWSAGVLSSSLLE